MNSIWKCVVAGLVGSSSAGTAYAGDWREITRGDGSVVAMDVSALRRSGSKLSIDLAVAFLPERLMPLYGIMQADIDCESLTVVVGGAQFYLANGDPFGQRTAGLAKGSFGGDEEVQGYCDGDLPQGPGRAARSPFSSL